MNYPVTVTFTTSPRIHILDPAWWSLSQGYWSGQIPEPTPSMCGAEGVRRSHMAFRRTEYEGLNRELGESVCIDCAFALGAYLGAKP